MDKVSNPRKTIRFGVFEADLRAGELRRDGRKVRIQDQPFRLLVVLLERPGEVVTREELREILWPKDTYLDFDRSLNTTVAKLREALGESAESARYVETLPRRGYRFLAEVETADAPAVEKVATLHIPADGSRRRKLVWATGLVLLAVIAVWFALWRSTTKAPETALTPVPLTSSAPPSLRTETRWRFPGTARTRTTMTFTASSSAPEGRCCA